MALDLFHLPDPPCISRLLGCDAGSTSSSGVLNEPLGSLDNGGFPLLGSGGSSSVASSSSSSSFFRSSRSSFSSSSALYDGQSPSSSSPSLFGRIGQGREALAQYVLTAKNGGTEALRNVKIFHGPLPFGAIFEPGHSSGNCTQEGTSVACLTALGPGASSDVTLTYRVSSAVSCAIARVLQQARATAQSLTGSANHQVSVSVRCSMLPSDTPVTAASSASSSSLATAVIAGTSLTTETIAAVEGGYKCIPGYKGKGGCPPPAPPRTGADAALFAAVLHDGSLLTPVVHHQSDSGIFSQWPLIASSIVIALAGVALLRCLKFRKTA